MSSSFYHPVVDIIMPNRPTAEKQAYDDMVCSKAKLQDKFLLGLISQEQYTKAKLTAEELFQSKCY